MSNDTPERDDRSSPKLKHWLLGLAVGLIAVGTVAVLSWRGCVPEDPLTVAQREAEEKKKKEEEAEKKEKKDPKVERVVLMPGEPEAVRQFVKPGHWTTTSQQMKAIYKDFVGRAQISVISRKDGVEEVLGIDRTQFVLEASRPVTLSKGRPKTIETTFFVPQVDRSLQVKTELIERGLGKNLSSYTLVTEMPAYQYHFVVLATEPARYTFIKQIDSVKVPYDGESEFDDSDDPVHYRVELHRVDRTIPLADNPLAWTSIAYILWDEVDPALFTPDQERTLLDWLHWGGQLIVNGPDSLDLLKGSFLEPYLPATNGGSRSIAAGDPALVELNRGWMISTASAPGRPLVPTKPWSGIKLDLQPGGKELHSTGGLLVERSVGRGRIVVSAMQLAEQDFVNWESGYQSLFNACLLRRPQREYREGKFGDVTLAWADPIPRTRRLDARLTTGLRYMARDLGVDTSYRFVDVPDPYGQIIYPNVQGNDPTIRRYRPPAKVGGLGAWNDFSATANAAREALKEAAGVEVPSTSFVVLWLAAYLILLVPLNWLVFHAVGRIEWAWIAAPVIAIAGTFVVIRQAQLDIGFVRAQTEIGFLELQRDYARGHLTRYTSLYTSLSTTYDLEFDSLTAVAAPFPSGPDPPPASRSTCDYHRYDKSRLTGVFVSSNTARWVHSEQMFRLDGAIRLGTSSVQQREQIENRSQFHLKSVAVVERPTSGDRLRGTWIGELRPGESARLGGLRLLRATDEKAAFADERAAEERLQLVERLNLEPTFRLALDPNNFKPGDRWLVARIDEVLPGETISPAASQVHGATMVVAHLRYAPRPTPEPDRNIVSSVAKN